MSDGIRVSVLGASGFTGRELVRILARHPKVEIDTLYSRSHAGKNIEEIHHSLRGIVSHKLVEPTCEGGVEKSDVVFLALPHTRAFKYVPSLMNKTKLVIDLSADYRFKDAAEYTKWYDIEHGDRENLKSAVYGIPEINRNEIKNAKLIANPGCYATAVILSAYPLLAENLIDGSIYVDAKSGISGAGQKLGPEYLYLKRHDNVAPYNVNSHRHMGEIINFLNRTTGKKYTSFVFCPHFIPMERGILSNIYTKIKKKISEDYVRDIFLKYYKKEHFINICQKDKFPQTQEVAFTNNCNIGIRVNPSTGDVIVITAIDNLVKGASGQAVQNMNIASGFPETLGLV